MANGSDTSEQRAVKLGKRSGDTLLGLGRDIIHQIPGMCVIAFIWYVTNIELIKRTDGELSCWKREYALQEQADAQAALAQAHD